MSTSMWSNRRLVRILQATGPSNTSLTAKKIRRQEEALKPIEEDRRDAYFWLDVGEARQEGIWPIPWR